MKIGDKLKITKKKEGKGSARIEREQRTARIYSFTKNLLVVIYRKDNKNLFRESFSIGEILSGSAEIEIWENKKWRSIVKEDLKVLGGLHG